MKLRGLGDFVIRKVLDIDPNERYSTQPANLEQRARDALHPVDTYLEDEPTVVEWLKSLQPTIDDSVHYIHTLFPSWGWLRRYNMQWLGGDVVAGITVGLVVVPQAMAYAVLARLTPAYGLYTSFTGAIVYPVFGTSRDIVIGTTAVGSLLVGQVIGRIDEAAPNKYTHEETAHALSMTAGLILLFFGLLRLGWVIEFIPYIPISAFITAASITIMSTQVPVLLGIQGIDTREAPYKVIINTLKNLSDARTDAAIGMSSVALLYAIRSFFSMMERRRPHQKRLWSFLSSLRLTFTMLLFTLISFLIHRKLPLEEAVFRIIGPIERGFQRAYVPRPDPKLINLILPELPAVAIILVIEHIAIAKAMGRLHNYTINPSQEIVALGISNLLSPFVGGYVCTGSFGASAVLSKAGVRTPLAGLFSALIVVLALYALTAAFYYIPNSALAGLIIHAVYNLLTPPKSLYKYWQLSPIELFIWVIGVFAAIFDSLETSIYVGVILSILLLLFRIARTRGRFLGEVRAKRTASKMVALESEQSSTTATQKEEGPYRSIYMPLDRKDASNPDVSVASPYPGIFIYRLNEGYNYTNQAFHVEILMNHIMKNTKRSSEDHYEDESDRLWNDPGLLGGKTDSENFPPLRAIVLDFASVNHIDITSIQGMVDLRTALDRYSSPDAVEWHFANVENRWTRRALAAAGFGYPTSRNEEALSHWKPAYDFAGVVESDAASSTEQLQRPGVEWDEEHVPQHSMFTLGDDSRDDEVIFTHGDSHGNTTPGASPNTLMATVYGVDRPFFHADLPEAVASAMRDAQSKDAGVEMYGQNPFE